MKIYHTSQNQVDSIHGIFFAQKPKACSGPKQTLHGNIYQLKLLMLFLKRGLDKNYNFLLSTETNEAEKFNDLVFQYENDTKNGMVYRFLQAKHKQDVQKKKNKITVSELLSKDPKRPFSLQKYFISFLKIQEQGNFEGKIRDFIICTNTDFDFELRKGEHKKTQENKKRWKNYFQDITKTIKDEILDVDDNGRRYQFINASNVKRQEVVSELYGGFKNALEIELEKNKNLKKALEEKKELGLEGSIGKFLDKLVFAVNQPNEIELGKIIQREIGKEFTFIDSEDDYNRFFVRMLDWMKEKKVRFLSHKEGEDFFKEARRGLSIWFDVKEPVELFTGREGVLESLHKAVQDNVGKGTVISQMTSVSGLGGIGKSELIRKYIQKHSQDYDRNVMWINAENYETLVQSFTRLAKDKLNIVMEDGNGKPKEIKSIVEAVYRYFVKQKSLFIFDNAGKYRSEVDESTGERKEDEGIDKFLSSLPEDANKPSILITSRNQVWGNIKVIQLGIFNEPEAIEFIKKALKIKDNAQDQNVVRLAETLQRFPLALQQAVAYIKQADEEIKNVSPERGFTINDYLKEYKEKEKELLDYPFPDDSSDLYTKTTFTAWKVTIDKIRKNKKYGQQTLDVLDIIAYFAPDNIPTKTFLKLSDISERKLGAIIQLLKQYSMIELEQGMLSIHRLVQQVTRINLKEQGREEEVICRSFCLLKEDFPNGGDKAEDYVKKRQLLPHCEACLPHFDDCLARESEDVQEIETHYLAGLLFMMSDGYSDLGNPKRQKELLERILAIQERHYGPDHFKFAIALANLGGAYGDLGDPNKQKELQERALPILEKHYGPDHFEFAIALANLGGAYGDLGDPNKQKELQERALPILEKHYGIDHFRVAIILESLGGAYGDLGDHNKQKELQERALPILEKHYGIDHFIVATILVNLGSTYRALGDPDRQRKLLERALPILEKHYGTDHFEVASALNNLGTVYWVLGNLDKQKELLERALAIKEKYYGPDHFEIAITLVNLGKAYGDLDDPNKQKELQERALPILEKRYGLDHFRIAITLVSLGDAYGKLDDPNKQKELLERALPILERYYGLNHFEVAKILEDLGCIHILLGDPNKAKELLERALVIQEKHYGPDNFEVAKTLGSLGNAHILLGDPNKAKELLERALVIQERHYGPDHFEVARTLGSLGNAYGNLGNHNKQKELLERALAVQERHYEPDHLEVAITLIGLGHAYGNLGDHNKQKEFLERALPILERHYGIDNFRVAITLISLGHAYGKLGDHNKQKVTLPRKSVEEVKPFLR